MTASAAESGPTATVAWQEIVSGGAKLGLATVIGVVVFALVSRATEGMAETVLQSLLILAGGTVFAFLPSRLYRPRDADSIAWVAMIGLLGSLFFTVVDTAILRPLDLYPWTWDAIGGGSGFWYVPVWWMGSATLAWLGAWAVANGSGSGDSANVPRAAAQAVGIAVVVAAILMAAGVVPFHSAGVALAFGVAAVLNVPLSAVLKSG